MWKKIQQTSLRQRGPCRAVEPYGDAEAQVTQVFQRAKLDWGVQIPQSTPDSGGIKPKSGVQTGVQDDFEFSTMQDS